MNADLYTFLFTSYQIPSGSSLSRRCRRFTAFSNALPEDSWSRLSTMSSCSCDELSSGATAVRIELQVEERMGRA